ncbi:MAG: S8 family serine peptidase, partial [Planctomycetes bacterium]|nr:S8 family serine peptidase [Planctomycetota bacterium]
MARFVCVSFTLFALWLTGWSFADGDRRAVDGPQRRGEAGPNVSPSVVPGDYLGRWYPYEIRPPFDAVPGVADHPTIVHAGNARFRVGDPPAVPDELTIRPGEANDFPAGYWIVHFRGGVDDEARDLLDSLTDEVRGPDGRTLARWYLPNRALIAWVDAPDTLAELRNDDRVDWVGRYEPAYKLSPRIGEIELTSADRLGRNVYVLNVDLIPGHEARAVAADLEALGLRVRREVYLPGLQTYDVHYLIVEARAAQIVDIAHVEGVRYIQETGDGPAIHDLSGGGKLQNRTLSVDDGTNSPIVDASSFPLWLVHDLQGQGQLIGVVDTSIDWNNTGTTGCGTGYPDTAIDNWGFALPNLARVMLPSVGAGGVNLKIPRGDELGGATMQGSSAGEHGCGVAGAALGDFYGNDDTRWWEHDVDTWESWAPSNFSGLLGPGIAHEAQLYFTPVNNSSGQFRWEFAGEFESNMATTLNNMRNAGVCTTNHSVGLAESSNTYTQTTVVHDTAAFDHPDMLQCMAAGNSGAVSNALTSQAVAKNGLAVGASDDVLQPENRASFSSIGPAFDGRIKPDVMAPGTDDAGRSGGVQSLLILPQSNGTSSASCAYQWTAGTSFASPTMAGAGALVHQYFEEGRYGGSPAILDPSAALMKAMLVNGGHRLTGANLGNGQYPNSYQGWGETNLSDVLDLPGGARRLVARDVASSSGFTGPASPAQSLTVNVNSSSQRLRVTLAWTDEPGSTGIGKKLINDLHLTVTSPSGATYRGNVINGATGESTTGGAADTDNNVENVILSSPQTGTWTVSVSAGDGNYSVGQGYGLVITGDVSEGTGPAAPVAEFTGTPTSGTTPLTVSFTDLSTGSISGWSWSFGDGGTSTASSPSHTYTVAGTYTVSLTVNGPGGSDTRTRVSYISVSDPVAPPVAEFVGSPTSGTAPLTVSFTDQSTGSISSRSWSFGDGGTSTAASPSH